MTSRHFWEETHNLVGKYIYLHWACMYIEKSEICKYTKYHVHCVCVCIMYIYKCVYLCRFKTVKVLIVIEIPAILHN